VLEPQSIYVKLPGDVADALMRVAQTEWRNPRDQAGLFIADGLRRAGALPTEDTALTNTDPRVAAIAAAS
jgi:hypothetical protein